MPTSSSTQGSRGLVFALLSNPLVRVLAGVVAIATALYGFALWQRNDAVQEVQQEQIVREVEEYKEVRKDVQKAVRRAPAAAADAREWLREYVR